MLVVGTQSSGKSSLLNGIMGADILPLGEQMVTRSPLQLQLVHTPDASAMRAEFGDFAHGAWVTAETVNLTCPDPTPTQLGQIRGAIEAHTATRAGTQKGVSTQPIFLRLYSPHVPNLSLVDLPGLTMTALTAQGQPKDIKEQIREHGRVVHLAAAHHHPHGLPPRARPRGRRSPPSSAARADLARASARWACWPRSTSAERGWGRTWGCYLTNSVRPTCSCHHGYFAVKMRGPQEARLTVREGFGTEAAYFRGHPSYGKPHGAVRGAPRRPHLTRFLSRVLLQHLRQHLPQHLTRS